MTGFAPWADRSGKRKRLNMSVTVTVPVEMTAAQARKEVRTLISDQCNWSAWEDDVKAIKVAPLRVRT